MAGDNLPFVLPTKYCTAHSKGTGIWMQRVAA